MNPALHPISPVKSAVLLESAGWATCGAIFARGKDVAVVADGVMRIVPAARWAEFLDSAKFGTLCTIEAQPLPETLEQSAEELEYILALSELCECEGQICGGVLAGGPCDSEDADD